MFPAPIGNSIFTNKIYFFMTYFNERTSKFQYMYPFVFNVRKTKQNKIKQILSKSGFPYEFLDWNPTNSFLSYSKHFPYERENQILVSRDVSADPHSS